MSEVALDTPSVVRVEQPRRSALFVRLKRCVQTAFFLWALPRLIIYWLARRVLGRPAFGAASESIARVPGFRGQYLRQAFYQATLSACGRDAYFGWMSVVSMPEASVGERAYIGRFCTIGFAEIGEEAMLADHVQILSGGREHGQAAGGSMHEQPQTYLRVRIGRGAWIGAGAVVMADVGAGAIVGAGAVVTRPVPPRSVAVGVPAKVIKSLDDNQ